MESIPENLQELSRQLEKAVAEDDEGDWKRFRLPNGQLARMSFSYKDKTGLKYGFRSARVTLETPKAEKAIVAALVALEGKKVEPERLRFASILAETLNKAQANEYSSLRDWAEDLRSNSRLGKAESGDWHSVSTVRYLRELLHHYRPELDELPEYEQVALLEGAAKHINEFLEALRKLTTFLESGDPYTGNPKNMVEKAERYLEAAELKDVMGFSQREVGDELGLPLSETDRIQGGHARANQYVREGRKIFEGVLGEDGYQEYIEDKKAEVEWWRSITVEQKHAELYAETFDMPAETVLRIMTGDFEEETAKLEPDKLVTALYIRIAYEAWELSDDPDQQLVPRTQSE